MIRTYRELRRFESLRERYDYLRLGGIVGQDTFGFDRYLNQDFYRSAMWKHARNHVIARDNGCDLGIQGFEIHDRVYVHHMNPMTPDQIKHGDVDLLDPEYLICVSLTTHNAIHYGDERLLPRDYVPRRPGDTKLW
jgi:hypothetical protein